MTRPYTINRGGVCAVISRKDPWGEEEFVEVPCDIKPGEAERRNLAFEEERGLGHQKGEMVKVGPGLSLRAIKIL